MRVTALNKPVQTLFTNPLTRFLIHSDVCRYLFSINTKFQPSLITRKIDIFPLKFALLHSYLCIPKQLKHLVNSVNSGHVLFTSVFINFPALSKLTFLEFWKDHLLFKRGCSNLFFNIFLSDRVFDYLLIPKTKVCLLIMKYIFGTDTRSEQIKYYNQGYSVQNRMHPSCSH